MTQKTIKFFLDESYSKPPKKNYPINRTDVYHLDDIWSLDNSDLKDYGPENNRGYKFVVVESIISQNLVGQFLSKIKFLKQ